MKKPVNIIDKTETIQLSNQISVHIRNAEIEAAYQILLPVLAKRTPFRILDQISWLVWQQSGMTFHSQIDQFNERIAADRSEGGWVIIASLLQGMLAEDMASTFHRAQRFIRFANLWYATDTMGERVLGPALLLDFETALNLLSFWRENENPWIRRSVGVAIHFWAKRCHNNPKNADKLLSFLEPLFNEQQIEAIKGIGWGLKTLGRHYPDQLTQWLLCQMESRPIKPPKLMLSKAITYLPMEDKRRILERTPQ